ncbi:MAG: SMC-Scp complex subunit ScpB [Porticoccaceae bacterium]
MNSELIKKILEGALLAAGKSLTVVQLEALFEDEQRPPRDQLKAALEDIEADCRDRGFELKQTASGYRFQVCQELSPWVNKLWEEKPKRYSRALLETLSLIAYRQPLTRGDIELVRGVAVSSDIIRSLMEREWIRVVGHRDVPGKPALYATTKQFLDYFNLKSLEHLPALSELKDLTELDPELEMTLAAGASSDSQVAEAQSSDTHAAVDTELAVEPQIDGVDQQDSQAEPESLNPSSTTDE